jgi:hypothetical protein
MSHGGPTALDAAASMIKAAHASLTSFGDVTDLGNFNGRSQAFGFVHPSLFDEKRIRADD